jgi:hypothetical protein
MHTLTKAELIAALEAIEGDNLQVTVGGDVQGHNVPLIDVVATPRGVVLWASRFVQQETNLLYVEAAETDSGNYCVAIHDTLEKRQFKFGNFDSLLDAEMIRDYLYDNYDQLLREYAMGPDMVDALIQRGLQ